MFKRGTFIRYFVQVALERPDRYKFNVSRQFPVKVIACPTTFPASPSYPMEQEQTNQNDVHLRAAVTNRDPVMPGIDLVLNIYLHNPKRVIIKSITAQLVQHRV